MSKTRTVLVVDDDQDGRALLAELLRARGYDVIEAWDGLDGLERLHEARREIGAIVLDLEMPNIDGVEFRRQQEHYPLLRTVPVVITSGHAHASMIAADLGAVAVVIKPISIPLVLAALAKAFQVAL